MGQGRARPLGHPASTDFDEVCSLLQAGHAQPGKNHTPEQTLNRLFRKHMSGQGITGDLPWLSSGNVGVTLETWPKPALRRLAPRERSRRPRCTEPPVVIIRFRGRDWLIDGGSRAHGWHEAGDTGEHPAYVLTVPDMAGSPTR